MKVLFSFGFTNPSGGLGYHLLARRYRNTLWKPFRVQINSWLSAWTPRAKKLLWIGSSAGYSVERSFLEKFEEIVVVEPDLVARWILLRRFPGVSIQFEKEKKFSIHNEDLRDLFLKYPEHSIFFSNLLGQLGVLFPDWVGSADFEVWKKNLNLQLKGRDFLSYHDRLSGSLQPQFPRGDSIASFGGALSNQELLSQFFNESQSLDERSSETSSEDRELIDHFTEGLLESFDGPRSYFKWALAPQQNHLIEGFKFERP